MIILMYVPIVALLIFSANILEKFGQDPQVTEQARYFIFTLIPGSLIIGLEDLQRKFLTQVNKSVI